MSIHEEVEATMDAKLNRRQVVWSGLAAGAALATPRGLSAERARNERDGSVAGDSAETETAKKDVAAKFRYCLNTATIRGHKLPLVEQIALAAKAGYDGIEPWIGDIEAHKSGGGSLADLKKQIVDLGLTVDGAIGFAPWIVDDAARAKGLEQAKRDMDLVAQIGGTHIAAPPAGATDKSDLDLRKAGERYRALLEAGDAIGVVPQVEVWGFSKSLSRLSECAFVAIESGHPKACLLTDVYHLYKGGSDFASFALVAGAAMHCMHMNDYPADPPRERIADRDRVYPGDGVAPLDDILRALDRGGFRGVLSLELFNPTYWKRDALEVARMGLEKMQQSVRSALG
jgi:sugar phosphate isomerase/epimerase